MPCIIDDVILFVVPDVFRVPVHSVKSHSEK